ncbi:MAG: polysaccharide deacetylase family protein [Deltaproteobacteria bacterium]|jgi:peptidoglycan/xylan/chitin deacetylase (PgdA/CDA1 family)|nr:polysaccharide deacetylase family protein [Deltaproteobacteria bacterium]MBW2535065.1 polysaccharide deacetylase family protein [Deltaproteobacteria bacterium]
MTAWVCATVDLDPVDCYLANRGLTPRSTTNLNAVYDEGLERFLDLLRRHAIRATFFVVGRDAERADNADRLRRAAGQGHEVANHSYSHPLDLASCSRSELLDQIIAAEQAIEQATGTPVRGFRAPSWNVGPELFRVLRDRQYRYDSSLVPLRRLRLFQAFTRLAPRVFGQQLFSGQARWPTPPGRPYRLAVERPWLPDPHGALWEIPHGVSDGVVPLPLNATALALLGDRLGSLSAAWAAHRSGPLVLGFHGIDLVDYYGAIGDGRLSRKPGLAVPLRVKLARVDRLLRIFGRGRTWTRLCDLALAAEDG